MNPGTVARLTLANDFEVSDFLSLFGMRVTVVAKTIPLLIRFHPRNPWLAFRYS